MPPLLLVFHNKVTRKFRLDPGDYKVYTILVGCYIHKGAKRSIVFGEKFVYDGMSEYGWNVLTLQFILRVLQTLLHYKT